MGVNICLHRNQMAGDWKFFGKRKIFKFLRSEIRRSVSGYPNFWRLIWWKLDLTVEWL